MNNLWNMQLKAAIAIIGILWLASCGSGGSTTPSTNDTPVQQTAVVLAEVTSAEKGIVTASWMPASDDPAVAPTLTYELHMNTPSGDFVPTSQTLKFRGQAALSAKIEGLESGVNYSVKLVVENSSGQRFVGDAQTVKVSDVTVAYVSGVQVTTLNTEQVLAIDSVANTLTLQAGTTIPTPGTILSGDSHGGFLLRVVSTQQQADGSILVNTAVAALNEVLQDFSLSSSISLVPVPGEMDSVQAGVVVTRSVQGGASVNWQQTGFTLSSAEPRQALKPMLTNGVLQAGATAAGSIQFSESKVSASGDWGAISAPSRVDMAEGQATPQTINIGVNINSNLEVCHYTVMDDGNEGLLAKAQGKNISLTTEGIAPDLYTVKLRAYVDDVGDGCNGDGWGVWAEKPEIEITVGVTNDSKKFNQEAKTLTFTGGFNVSNTVEFQFDPTLMMEVQMRAKRAHFEVAAQPSVTQTLTVDATGAATLAPPPQTLIQKRKFAKLVSAGGVPVLIEGEFWLDVEVSGSTTGAIHATEKLELGFEKLNYGMIYDGSQWVQINTAQPKYNFTIEGDAHATAHVEVALVPHLNMKVMRVATANLAVRPYLTGDAGLQGKLYVNQNSGGLTYDADAWLSQGELNAGVDAYLYADLGAFDITWLSYPSGADPVDYKTYKQITLIPATTIAAIPTFSAQVLNDTHPADSRAVLIRATATDIPNPLAFGPASFLPFMDWQTPRVVSSSNTASYLVDPPGGGTGESVSGLVHTKDFWLVIEKPGTYTVRMGGNSLMGSWARQVAPEVVLNYSDANGDGIPDPWATKFGSTNLEQWQVGDNPATPSNNKPPAASFTKTINGLNVSYDASSSTDSDGSVSSYRWFFGDGSIGRGMKVSRNYAKAGTYAVNLIVTDNKGATNSTSLDVTIGTPPVEAAAPKIGGINPNSVTGSNVRQVFTINGSGFVSKPTLTLAFSGQPNYTVPDAQVAYLSSTQLQMSVVTKPIADNWTVKVTNPDGKVSNTASFAVLAPAAIPKPTAFTVSGKPYCTGGKPAVQLNWTGSSGVTSYDLYRNGSLHFLGVPSYTTDFSNTTNLAVGQSYSYYVIAKNASGNTTSNTASVSIPGNVCDQTTVSGLTASQSSAGQVINGSFSVNGYSVTRVRVHAGSSADGTYACYTDLAASTGSKSFSFNGNWANENGQSCAALLPAAGGTSTLYFKVEVRDSAGNVANAGTAPVVSASYVATAATAVSGLTASQSSAGQAISGSFSVSGTSVSMVKVHAGSSSGGTYACFTNLTASAGSKNFSFNGNWTNENGQSCAALLPGTGSRTIYFKVEARDAANNLANAGTPPVTSASYAAAGSSGTGGIATASGTYTWNAGTGTLTLSTTTSNFVCSGPKMGVETVGVGILITSTTMTWLPPDSTTWTRASGAANDIVGVWTQTQQNANSFVLTFNANGTYTGSGTDECAGVWANYGQGGYNVGLEYRGTTATAVSVSGPGITGSVALTYNAGYGSWGGVNNQSYNVYLGSSNPTGLPYTYTFTVTTANGTTTETRPLTCFAQELVSNLAPTGTVSGAIIFSWTGIADPGMTYGVWMQDPNIVGNVALWNTNNLTGTSVVYGGPALTPGTTYNYSVQANNFSTCNSGSTYVVGSFTYQ